VTAGFIGDTGRDGASSGASAGEDGSRLAGPGLVVVQGDSDGGARDGSRPVLTPAGQDTVANLIEARRQGLAELLEGLVAGGP
jgi:hypothetical protein